MKIRRTGTRWGESPTWYVWADRPEEQAAIRVGFLNEKSPNKRLRYVLAWGFESQKAAEDEMDRLFDQVRDAVALIESNEVVQSAQAVLGRLFLDEARVSAHNAELRILERELSRLSRDLSSNRLRALATELEKLVARGQQLHERLLNTVQAACMLCSLSKRIGDDASHSERQ